MKNNTEIEIKNLWIKLPEKETNTFIDEVEKLCLKYAVSKADYHFQFSGTR